MLRAIILTLIVLSGTILAAANKRTDLKPVDPENCGNEAVNT
jgi:hypothetical protein